MRIRCFDCRKKIQIDEAFAGGICRCPFCKSMISVPQKKRKNKCPERPLEPSAKADSSNLQAQKSIQPEQIPIADPAKFVGILKLAITGALVAAGAVVAFFIFT